MVLEKITMKKLSKMKSAEPWNDRPSSVIVSALQPLKLSKLSNEGTFIFFSFQDFQIKLGASSRWSSSFNRRAECGPNHQQEYAPHFTIFEPTPFIGYISNFSDWGYCFIDFKNHKQAALAKRIGIRDLFEGKEKVRYLLNFSIRVRSYSYLGLNIRFCGDRDYF